MAENRSAIGRVLALEGASAYFRVLLDTRPCRGATGARGVGRYVHSMLAGFEALPRSAGMDPVSGTARTLQHRLPSPQVLSSRILGARWIRHSGADLYHATFLAPLRAPAYFPWVATIHDLIPLRYPAGFTRRQHLAFRLSLRWNAMATRVACVSPFTSDLAMRDLGVPSERTRVVPPRWKLLKLVRRFRRPGTRLRREPTTSSTVAASTPSRASPTCSCPR